MASMTMRRILTLVALGAYIYSVDRASTGLHIIELTGRAREIVGLQ